MPNVMDLIPGRNPLPVMVTLVPPVVGPELGEQNVMLTPLGVDVGVGVGVGAGVGVRVGVGVGVGV